MRKYEFTKEQQQIYLMDKFGEKSIAGVAVSIMLRGSCSETMLLKSAYELVKRCDIFHLQVHENREELFQVFVPPENFEIKIRKFPHENDLSEWAQVDAKNAIDLSGRLFEICGVITEHHFGIYIKMHHIICDAWTGDLLAETFADICNNYLINENPKLRCFSFEKYLCSVVNDKAKVERARKFWERQLDISTNCVTLAYREGQHQASNRIIHNISKSDWDLVMNFCDKHGVSPYVVCLTALGILVNAMTREEMFYIGTTLYNRVGANEKKTMGMFVDTAPVFINLNKNMKIMDAIESVYESTMNTMKNCKFVYGDILALIAEKYKSNQKLYEISLNYQINHLNKRTDVKTEWFHCGSQTNSLDIHMREHGDSLQVYYDYHVEKFNQNEINNIHKHFRQILKVIVENSDQKVCDIDSVTDDEKEIIINHFNNTRTVYPSHKSIGELFDEQVGRYPDAVAISCEETELSYAQLNEKANAVAKCLLQTGIKKDDCVAIVSEKCPEMIVGIVGIIKAGAAYVPINPSYPKERIQFILEDSNPKVILTYQTDVESCFTKIRYHDILAEGGSIPNIVCGNPHDSAYIIYTSGTTGKPKGVIIEHKNVVRLVKNTNYITLNEKSVILQTGDISFDASTFEIWGALLNGGKLVLANKEILMTPKKLKKIIRQKKINSMFITTALFNQLVEYDSAIFSSLDYLLFGGEKTSEEFVKVFLENENNKNVRIFNVYGPTEATTFSSYYEIKKGVYTEKTPIGRPIANSTCYIMDGEKLCGIGVAGELCLGGDGIGRGYLNRPELSAEKFIKNPFGEGSLYRSGDLAKWLDDGNIEYLGRIDEQVKIRGFRIELGEIESVIRSVYEIKDAAVIVKEDKGEKFICAYIVSDIDINLYDLKSFLKENMPDYMIPSYFMQISSIPFTSNGKVDKKALPTIEIREDKNYVAPRTQTEQILCSIFSSILGIEKVGITESFFELGGHSLRAIKLINAIESELNIHLEIAEIFANSTAEQLAILIINKEHEGYETIPVAEPKEEYVMSSIQKRIYFVCQLNPNGITYNIPQTFLLKGNLQIERVRTTLQEMMNRHEILRTEFLLKDGEFIQSIRDSVEADFEYEENFVTSEKELEKNFVRPFNLNHAPLLRMKAVKRAENQYLLMMDIHHIISDGMSQVNFIREFSEIYNNKKVKPVLRQYKDYSEWMVTRDLFKQRDYWVNRFSDEIPVLQMPLDFQRPTEQKFDGDMIINVMSSETSKKIRDFVYEKGITSNMFYLAALMILLGKYAKQEDVIVGIPISGRIHKDTEEMLGMFVNTLAMRGRPEKDKKIGIFLDEIKECCLNAYQNQEFPFEELLDAIDFRRDMSRNPLFDVMLAVQNNEQVQYDLDGIKAKEIRQESTISKFDMMFDIVDKEDGIRIALEYCTAIFTRETAENVLAHFKQVLLQIIEKSSMKIGDIEMNTYEEKQKILGVFNTAASPFKMNKSLIQILEEQVDRKPEATALLYRDTEISYALFNQKVNVLAHKLKGIGVKPNDFIIIAAERSIEMILGIYAILKAGAAYVPVDPLYPTERVNYIIEDCKPKAILTYHVNIFSSLPIFDLEDDRVWKGNTENPDFVNKPEDFVYCIYTSGTTGKPKGVLNMHKGLFNLISWMQTKYPLTSQDAILQKTTFVFDVSASEIFWWCFSGAKLVILEPEGEKDPVIIANEIERSKISVIDFVPSMLSVFLGMLEKDETWARKLVSLKYVIAAGEALNAGIVDHFYRLMGDINASVMLANLYGPTEASIYASWFECRAGMNDIPIGKPVGNDQLYILDGMQLCGIGVPGELCIAGIGVAKGYLNREELTEEKFVQNPYGKGKMYRTGDLVRWLPDGNIAYLGRMDKQVKIRGFRIEIGEIENVLRKLQNVTDCAVIAREKAGVGYLSAYIVSDFPINVDEIRDYLRRELPEYMIPSYFMQVKEIPVTKNGKLDGNALPEIAVTTERVFIAPKTPVEKSLCDAFCEILGISQISIADNFFELGGDSIKAIRIVSKMREAGYEVSVKVIMHEHSIEDIAYHVTRLGGKSYEQGEVTGEVLPTPIMKKFLHWNLKRPEYFNQAMVLPLNVNDTIENVQQVLCAIIQHHDILRMVVQDEKFIVKSWKDLTEPKIHVMDFREKANVWELSDAACTLLQGQMNLEKGPLMQVAYIMTDRQNFVFLCLHHLVVDGVSWRILQEDFGTGLRYVRRKEVIALPEKTASYIDWANALCQYAGSYQLEKERAYWQNEIEQLKSGAFAGKTFTGQTGYTEKKIYFSEQITRQLLYEAGKTYNTEINDLLIAALLMAVEQVTGQQKVTIGLEGHGREELDVPIAVDRTVGWFTAMYPITISCFDKIEDAILNAKDKLHKVPNHGIGYGLIEGAWEQMKADISFNYHGELMNESVIEINEIISTGNCSAAENVLPASINFNGSIEKRCLVFQVLYDRSQYGEEIINKLSQMYQIQLERIVQHCIEAEQKVQTASDFTADDLSMEDFEMIEDLL